MDYSIFTGTILKKVLAAMAVINNPEIAPDVRQRNQEILFQQVGASVYAKIYDMNAFDMQIEHTVGDSSVINDRYYGLAKVAAYSVSTGALGIDEYVKNYLDSVGAMAQRDAMNTAKENGKYPTASRRVNGEKNCKWCIEKQAENVRNPSASFFHRHGGCDCEIITSGYMTRNGLLDNYVKDKNNR